MKINVSEIMFRWCIIFDAVFIRARESNNVFTVYTNYSVNVADNFLLARNRVIVCNFSP